MSATAKAGLALANVLYEKRDGIAYVTVNRPKVLNALNTPTWADLRQAFEDARDDAAVRGVILTGAGDKAFIAGADIGELANATAVEAEQASRFGPGRSRCHRESRKAGDRGRQRLCARWRLRDGDGLYHQDRSRHSKIRPARSHARNSFRVAAERSGCRGWSVRVVPCSSFCPER